MALLHYTLCVIIPTRLPSGNITCMITQATGYNIHSTHSWSSSQPSNTGWSDRPDRSASDWQLCVRPYTCHQIDTCSLYSSGQFVWKNTCKPHNRWHHSVVWSRFQKELNHHRPYTEVQSVPTCGWETLLSGGSQISPPAPKSKQKSRQNLWSQLVRSWPLH